MMRSFRRIVIKGKQEQGVSVLFMLCMTEEIDLLLEVQNNFVASSSKYLFASLLSDTPLQGAQVIKEVAKRSGVANFLTITSN